MRKCLMAACVASLVLTGCGQRADESVAQQNAAPAAPVVAAAKPVKDHNYEAKDGLEYGYPSAVSEDARKGGQVAAQVLMFRYAGERDGKHQVHTSDGATVTALECSNPCELIKAMTFIDKDYLRNTVRVERLTNQPGSVAHAVLQDALNGKLRPYGIERGGKSYQVWVDEKRGFKEFAAKPTTNSGA